MRRKLSGRISLSSPSSWPPTILQSKSQSTNKSEIFHDNHQRGPSISPSQNSHHDQNFHKKPQRSHNWISPLKTWKLLQLENIRQVKMMYTRCQVVMINIILNTMMLIIINIKIPWMMPRWNRLWRREKKGPPYLSLFSPWLTFHIFVLSTMMMTLRMNWCHMYVNQAG